MATTFEGYSPLPHQRAVHKLLDNALGSSKIVVVKSRRQVGKSVMVEQELLRYAINYEGTVSACLSPTLSQARKVYQDIVDGIEDTGIIKKKNETLLELKLCNGSRIMFKSAEQKDNLRGYTISGILCIDEAAFIPDEIWNIVSPWVNVKRAPVLITSTPKFKEGFFYKYYFAGLTGAKWSRIKAVDFNDFDTSALLDPEKLEEYRRMLPANQFKTEFLGEFLDDDGVVFTGFKELIMEEGLQPDARELYIGIDWANGGGNDSTVVSAFNEMGDQAELFYFNDKGPSEQIEMIAKWLEANRSKIKKVIPELNSLGTPLTDMLKERLKKDGYRDILGKIEGRTTTNQTKVDMVADLQVAFEQSKVSLLNDEKQTRELSIYSAEYNMKTKKISYNAPVGSNDDCCIALMLAYQAYLTKGKTGDYMISIF